MRASCNKKEDNFISYHKNRERAIERVRDWEKLNPEKRKKYTIKYYKTEKGHRKRLAQQRRYREKKKLIKEIEKLKNNKMELLKRVDKAIEYINKNKYFYSGFQNEDLEIGLFENEINGLLEILKGGDVDD